MFTTLKKKLIEFLKLRKGYINYGSTNLTYFFDYNSKIVMYSTQTYDLYV